MVFYMLFCIYLIKIYMIIAVYLNNIDKIIELYYDLITISYKTFYKKEREVMKIKKRSCILLAVILVLSIAAIGCSKGDSSKKTNKDVSSEDTNTKAANKIVIFQSKVEIVA